MIRSLARTVMSLSGYPRPLRRLANNALPGPEYDIHPTADIHPPVTLGRGVSIGPQATVEPGCRVNGTVSIGRGTNFKRGVEAIGDVSVGRYCALARDSILQSFNHPTDRPSIQYTLNERLGVPLKNESKGPIRVGHDVWLGARTIVLSGVTIGTGAVVGAGSVVTKDVEPYAIVAGAPAEHRGWRFDSETREELLETAWWEWSEAEMRRRQDFFKSV